MSRGFPFTSTGTPTVTGDAVVGETLTVDPGEWVAGDADVSWSYQWLVRGKPVKGGTGDTYVVRSKDVGRQISVRVTGSAPTFLSTTVTSSPTGAVSRGFTKPKNEVARLGAATVL